MPYFDTVERLEVSTVRRKVEAMLNASGIPLPSNLDENFPPASDSEEHYSDAHNTDAGDRLDELMGAHRQRLTKVLTRHYMPDYKLFSMTPP